ncbi:tyrosine-type recombinase/integrase [Cereibacter sphaeroides]|jgi:integrase|uniref:tyrosine-type recombinase/integrase n=1 Tax=Cereibacter sphaeroides TaxID=1063 RepID=UPI0000663FE4|nr:phage integrase family protein [Cereibacter sphaeroides ATCC 17029]
MPLKLLKRGSVYYLRGTVAGHRVYESTRIGDKRQAEIFRARREAELIERAGSGKALTYTFAEAALCYMQAGGEGRYLDRIIKHFGPRFRIADLDNDAVNRASIALYPNAAPATINRQLVTPISAVYSLAADDGKAPPRRFRRRPEPKALPRWLTPEEAERLLAACDRRLLPLVAFLLGTGCRTGEALGLAVQHLHIETRQAHVGITKNGDGKMVSFPTRTKRILAACGLPEAGAVFRTPKGRPYRLVNGDGQKLGGQIKGAFDAARTAAKLGEDVTPHTLRHTFATWHYAVNKDLILLMERGGWKRADLAIGYTKLAPDDLPRRLLDHGWDMRAQSVHGDEVSDNFGSKISVLR